MSIRILCYGDSNTWGYISGSNHQRYNETERWPKILATLLGDQYEVIEEGLNSRTLTADDPRPGKEGRNGHQYLIPCLATHDPLDLVILMLGTNELKHAYNKSATEIGETLEKYFIDVILNYQSQIDGRTPQLLIVAPPLVNETTEYCQKNQKYLGAHQKSQDLNQIYRNIATKHNCLFLANNNLDTGPDGVHLTRESHRQLAKSLAKIITAYR